MLSRFTLILLIASSSLFAQQKPVVVLELFTSQGCSSCPPADRLLEEIKSASDNKQVIPIAYHVDYWDYIGWKDPFATRAYTDKQRDYADKFYSSSIYTPQLVINGDEHFVGSDRVKISRRIKQILHRGSSSNTVQINNAEIKNNTVEFSYTVEGEAKKSKLHFLLAINKRVTQVKRGENRNRTLANSNIVVQEEIVPLTKKNGKFTLNIPKLVTKDDTLRLVVLIKDKELTVTSGAQQVL